ncbi:hypothetical protein [Lacipirellula parvula]|uniref:PEP-CTERM protein-sorting domain-containing protein n=1 Tax=Lacipirellula parvula TaxID=2650471 RepID=A0A5K7XHB0_9BACT|nr:hypothetical protein [Lacipirellula parvula]BBO35828.1 hypothetical protein PLANPX_5440 [Lacipirellula parvula]
MKNLLTLIVLGTAVCLPLSFSGTARADVQIASFDLGFFEDALYASWVAPSATIDYGATSYNVTATGYGSNYVYIGALAIQGAGSTDIKLDVTLEGLPTADGHLGPIVTLIDADGTSANFAWYGQLLGNHVLTMPITSPTWYSAPGTTPGLDLNSLAHMHMQLDPGGYGSSGTYTVRWNDLSLITQAGVPGDFNSDSRVDGVDFLVWQRGGSPTALSPADLATWKANFGTGAAAPAVAAVPEPATFGLLAVAGLALYGVGRSQRVAR